MASLISSLGDVVVSSQVTIRLIVYNITSRNSGFRRRNDLVIASPSATLTHMTIIDRPGLAYSQELAEEKLRIFRSNDSELDQKIDSAMVLVSTLIYELTESDLREYLTLAGVNLTDWPQFERAKDIVSWFAVAGAVVVHDLYSFSIVDPGSYLAVEHTVDEEMQERMMSIKANGSFYRMTMEPGMA